MASTTYTGAASATTAYNPSDVYTLNLSPAAITNIAQSGANVVITTGATSLTITGVTLAALATTNFVLQGGGSVTFGDGLAAIVNDDSGNTLTGTALADILLGLGGPDTIDAGLGNNLIVGGSGFSDPVDAGDSITSGTGNDTIYGNGGNDTINSGAGIDVIYGGLGVDVINVIPNQGQTATVYGGGAAIDTLDASADTISVGSSGSTVTGAAAIYGNAGNDILTVYSSGNNSVYGGIGNDTVSVFGGGNNLVAGGTSDTDSITITGDGNNTVFGGTGLTDTTDLADTITLTGNGNNALYGNGGNDTISAIGTGNNSVYGGLGNDNLTVTGGGNNQVFGGTNDTDTIVVTGNGNNTVYGGAGENSATDLADTVTLVGTGNNALYGNGGNDTVNVGAGGGLGQNSVYGGVGDDVVTVNGGQAAGLNGALPVGSTMFVQAGTGSDSINTQNFIGNTTIIGGNATTDTTDAADTIRAGVGNDLIYGNGGVDIITSNTGNDTIFGGAGIDRILVNGAGNKVIGGNENGEQIFIEAAGGIVAGQYSASVNGGNVVLTGEGRTITFDGAINTIVNAGFIAGAADETGFVTAIPTAASLLLASFGSTATTLTGLANADVIYSGSANDTLIGGGGADTIVGGAGNDSINVSAGAGNVSITAGEGNDTVAFGATLDTNDTVGGGAGADVLTFTDADGATSDLNNVTGFETIVLGDAATSVTTLDTLVDAGATLTVNASALVTAGSTFTFAGGNESNGTFNITGGALVNTITGGGLADTITGGASGDGLVGGAGNDSITGAAGTDIITGGVGIDILNGGTGADTFIYAVAGDSGTPAVAVTTSNVTSATLDSVVAFESASDLISFDTAAGTSEAQLAAVAANTFNAGGFVQGTLATGVASATSLGAAITLVEAQFAAAGDVGAFRYGGNTYVVHDNGTAADGIVANVVQLTGFNGATLTENSANGDAFTVTV